MSIKLTTSTLSVTLSFKDDKVLSGTKTVEDIFSEDDKVLARVNTRTSDLSVSELEKWNSFINPTPSVNKEKLKPELEVANTLDEPEVPNATIKAESNLNNYPSDLNNHPADLDKPLSETTDNGGEEETLVSTKPQRKTRNSQ